MATSLRIYYYSKIHKTLKITLMTINKIMAEKTVVQTYYEMLCSY